MDSQLTLYCIRRKSTDTVVLKAYSRKLPLLFAHPHHAKAVLTNRLRRTGELARDFDIVPVYVTISALSVEEMADLDLADATVKERIKQLGLTCVKGGK